MERNQVVELESKSWVLRQDGGWVCMGGQPYECGGMKVQHDW